VFEWRKSFKEGQGSLEDNEQKGHLSISITKEPTELIQKCLAENRTLSVWMLEEMRGISTKTICRILVEDFKKKKCVLLWFLIC
jgi:hypothetical protein